MAKNKNIHPELTGNGEWCNFTNGKKPNLESSNYRQIIDFYLLNSPVNEVTVHSKKFKDYKWDDKQKLEQLNKLIIGSTVIINDNFKYVDLANLYTELENKKLVNKQKQLIEKAVFYYISGITETLFKAIRNSFAHGSYITKMNNDDIYYLIENRQPNGKKKYIECELRARMILKESTLLKWIDIVKAGPH